MAIITDAGLAQMNEKSTDWYVEKFGNGPLFTMDMVSFLRQAAADNRAIVEFVDDPSQFTNNATALEDLADRIELVVGLDLRPVVVRG